jgi:hypothetical protein
VVDAAQLLQRHLAQVLPQPEMPERGSDVPGGGEVVHAMQGNLTKASCYRHARKNLA